MALAEETTETCANGAGTIVIGSVSGHKYCYSKQGMNWWNGHAWCDAQGRRMFSLSDCGCSDTTANCANNICPELKNITTTEKYTGTSTPYNNTDRVYFVNLVSGKILSNWDSNFRTISRQFLCY